MVFCRYIIAISGFIGVKFFNFHSLFAVFSLSLPFSLPLIPFLSLWLAAVLCYDSALAPTDLLLAQSISFAIAIRTA